MKAKQAGQGDKTRIVSLSGFSFQRHVASIPLSAEHIRTPSLGTEGGILKNCLNQELLRRC
jgi:hypothetical protein